MRNNDFKDVKKVLDQYKKRKKMIAELSRQIEDMRLSVSGAKSPNYSGMPRGGAPVTFADRVADIRDLESRKERQEKIAVQKKEIVQSYIDTVLSVKHNKVLSMYFIDCKTMQEIASKEHYTDRHAYRIYREALGMVDMSLDL